MRLIIAAQNGRSILNWGPLMDLVESLGGHTSVIFFGSAAPKDVSWPEHQKKRWRHIADQTSANAPIELADVIRDEKPDIVLLATATAGLELEIAALVRDWPQRPLVVAAQHGVFQNWVRYRKLDCFDRFLTFGPYFLDLVKGDRRFRAGALPKLDLITPTRGRPVQGRLLLALQTISHEGILPLVQGLHRALGVTIILRPHPAAPHLHGELLREDYVQPDVHTDLAMSLQKVDGIITTGSTVVLEALAARVPVVVLPFQRGEIYGHQHLLASDFTVDAVLTVLDRFGEHGFWDLMNDFLRNASGSSSPNRAEIALAALEDMLRDQQGHV